MICDSMQNLIAYAGCFHGLDILLSWLQENRLEDLPLGRTEIDGDRVFVNVMNAQTRPQEGAEYEVHKRYMDLQLDLEGCERFSVSDFVQYNAKGFDEQADIGVGSGRSVCEGQLGEGRFALFLAGEPHMPTLCCQQPEPVKKVVVKILCNEAWK